jgi:hypothetical protein
LVFLDEDILKDNFGQKGFSSGRNAFSDQIRAAPLLYFTTESTLSRRVEGGVQNFRLCLRVAADEGHPHFSMTILITGNFKKINIHIRLRDITLSNQ